MKKIEKALTAVSAIGIFLLVMLICVSVFFRYFLNTPIIFANDLTTILLGTTIFAAYPWVTVRREHVSVELLGGLFAKFPKVDAARKFLIDIAVLAVLIFIMLRIGEQAFKYFNRGNYSQTMEWLLWPAVTAYTVLIAISVGLFGLQIIMELFAKFKNKEKNHG